MTSLSLGSRLTVQGRKVLMSLAVRTGVREDRKTSKLRTSPSISSSGSTSLVVGMFLDTLAGTRRRGELGAAWWAWAWAASPLVEGLQGGVVGDALGVLQVQDEPGRPVGPLLRQVDPGRQAVPVEGDLVGPQEPTCRQRRRRVSDGGGRVGGAADHRPVSEMMLSSLLMVWGLMSLNQSSVTISLLRSTDTCRVTERCACRRRYVSCTQQVVSSLVRW